jgi:putative hemolysin
MALLFEITIIIILIFANGFLAMAEFALVSSKKSRIMQHTKSDSKGAKAALELSEDPNSFLSAIQIGITLIGILAGAYGGVSVAAALAPVIITLFPRIEPISGTVSLLIIVVVITYFTLILGELVPKRLGMIAPESIAISVAYPIKLFSIITRPITKVIATSTDFVLATLQVNNNTDTSVTEEEISFLMEEGVSAGVFEKSEKQMVAKVFDFTDRPIRSIMQPRPDILALDLDSSIGEIIERINTTPHSRYPVYRTSLDTVIGIIEVRDLISQSPITREIFEKNLKKPLFVPNTLTSRTLLENFRQERASMALVVEEYGSICGLVTIHDLTEEIFGSMPDEDETDPDVVSRGQDSWIISATLPLHELKETLDIQLDQNQEQKHYHTISGFILATLENVPKTGDIIQTPKYTIEIVDMDGRRIDKIILTRRADATAEEKESTKPV